VPKPERNHESWRVRWPPLNATELAAVRSRCRRYSKLRAARPDTSAVSDASLGQGTAHADAARHARTLMLPPLKLVISTNPHYRLPLRQMLLSLAAVGFVAWRHVLIIVGGSVADEPPRLESLALLLAHAPANPAQHVAAVVNDDVNNDANDDANDGEATLTPESVPTPAMRVAVVRLRYQMSDYHGLAALYTYARHPLVAARGYLYALDTCQAHISFPARFEAVAAVFAPAECSTVVYTVPLPNSNLAAFGRGVVLAYQDHFRRLRLRTKHDGILVELGESPYEHRSLVAFASRVVLARKRREPCGWYDTFRTGATRRCWFYEEFGLYKLSKRPSPEETSRPLGHEWKLMRQPGAEKVERPPSGAE